MANNLTGNYDVVVQVSTAAIDRFLAVMHECERFLHSVSGYINDVPQPLGQQRPPVLTGVSDIFGKAVANQRHIPRQSFTGTLPVNDPVFALRPPIVNPGPLPTRTIAPSNLSGQVQLQVFPPTVDVPDASGTKLTVIMNFMARYMPDPGTAPIAQFLRGDLQIVAPLNQISTKPEFNHNRLIEVLQFDFQTDEATVTFTPTFSSSPLSDADSLAINLAIGNALKTSFQPSSVTLPSGVFALAFKTLLSGAQKAGALLLNLTNRPGDPAGVQQIALNATDDFAFAISPDYINSLLSSVIGQLTSFPPIAVSEWPFSATYTISLTSPPPALNFTSGAIQLVINAHAHSSGSIFPSFNFRTVVSFGLNLIAIDGQGRLGAAELSLTKVSLDFTDSGIGGDIKDLILGAFKGGITGNIAQAVNQILSSPDPNGIQATVRKQTNIDTQLGNMVNAFLKDPTTGDQPDSSLQLVFSYTSVDIEPNGVILRGLESVRAWADASVEFDQIPSQPPPTGPGGIIVGGLPQSGPDYTALNSWIPGGTITQYVWSTSSNNQLYPFGVDPHKFVLLHSTTVLPVDEVSRGVSLPPYTSLCLTVQGTRISMSGTGPAIAVNATVCGIHHLPLPGMDIGEVATAPTIALARRGPDGHVFVTGHAAPKAAGLAAPNLLVHFADPDSAINPTLLTEALHRAKRTDAPTVVMIVAPPGHLEKLHYNPYVIYAENDDAAWESTLGLGKATLPMTIIIGPTGKILWRHEGRLDRELLSAALTKMLVSTFTGPPQLLRLNVTLGQRAPDFLFEYAPGRELTLSKLKGRRVSVAFWRSGSAPSLQAIAKAGQASNGMEPPLVLAINDGERAEDANLALSKAKISAIPVGDPGRAIAKAYGVAVWPTVISIDASGVISSIQLGNAENEHEHASAVNHQVTS